MRSYMITAGIVAALGSASVASAQQTCEQRSNDRVIGTVAGAGIGALLGSAIAGRGDKTAGAVIGGLGGGVVGNQVTRSNADCAHAYGYYDRNNAWHANDVRAENATGYYDRNGQWVNGAPNGSYDREGRWIANEWRRPARRLPRRARPLGTGIRKWLLRGRQPLCRRHGERLLRQRSLGRRSGNRALRQLWPLDRRDAQRPPRCRRPLGRQPRAGLLRRVGPLESW